MINAMPGQRILLVGLFPMLAARAHAQDAPLKFGTVTAADFAASPADTAAPAVMLCATGHARHPQ